MRALGGVLLAAAIGLLSQVGGLTPGPSPAYAQGALAIQGQFLDALNRGDPAGIEALLAPDFQVRNNANCTTPCDGRAELGVFLAIRLRVQVVSATESEDVVTSRIRATSNSFDLVAPGVREVQADTRLVVSGGKITLLDIQLDLSDPQSAELARQFRATRGPAAGPLDVQNQFVEALNRGNLTFLKSLVASNFTVTGNIGCTTPCAGSPYLDLFVAIRLRLSVLRTEVSGNAVISRVSAESTRFEQIAPGVNRVLADVRLTVTEGKVSALVIQLDVSDTLSAVLANELKDVPAIIAAAQAAAPQQPAATRLPATGNAGLLDGEAGSDSIAWQFGAVVAALGLFAIVALKRRAG